MSSEYAIIFENVTKSYGELKSIGQIKAFIDRIKNYQFDKKKLSQTQNFVALDNISFKVKKGEKVGIIGRNGCGKSTTLKLAQQVSQPTSGKITVNGRVGGLIELTAGFNGELTATENVYIGAALMGFSRSKTDEIIDWVFEIAELEKFRHTTFKKFSSGMKVRLGFCLAMASVPDIILLDEVLTVGDASFKKKSTKMMKEYLHERTMLYVSHGMGQVKSLCSRVIVLEEGKMVFDGPSEEGTELYKKLNADRRQGKIIKEVIPGANKRGVSLKCPVEVSNIKVENIENKLAYLSFTLSKVLDCDEFELKIEMAQPAIGSLTHIVSGSRLNVKGSDIKEPKDFKVKLNIENLIPGNYFINLSTEPLKNPSQYEKNIDTVPFTIAGTKQPTKYGVYDMKLELV